MASRETAGLLGVDGRAAAQPLPGAFEIDATA